MFWCVFGAVTDSQFERVRHDLKELMHEDEDSVRIYAFRTKEQVKLKQRRREGGYWVHNMK